ncbi:MAG: choice-of-anchor X domain-containing protein, partial [Candidatus Hydrothermarchaeaceae archaeon]
SPTTGAPVTINATLRDNAGNPVANDAQDNEGNSTRPAVMAIVTGSGEYFEINLYDDATNGDVVANDGIWSGQFTPQETGHHKIIVKAGDGHDKWVDGRGSKNIDVSGTFPYAFASGASILMVIFMILLAFKALMHLGYGQRVK